MRPGVALFVELGDVLKQTPPNVGVDLLFVDGEDYGDFSHDARRVARVHVLRRRTCRRRDYHPLYGVLWDMIGDRDLRDLPGGELACSRPPRSSSARLADGRRPRVRRVVHSANEVHDD